MRRYFITPVGTSILYFLCIGIIRWTKQQFRCIGWRTSLHCPDSSLSNFHIHWWVPH
jgi:hypothetical protein